MALFRFGVLAFDTRNFVFQRPYPFICCAEQTDIPRTLHYQIVFYVHTFVIRNSSAILVAPSCSPKYQYESYLSFDDGAATITRKNFLCVFAGADPRLTWSPVHHFRHPLPPPPPLAPTPDHVTELYVILAFLLEFTGFLRDFLKMTRQRLFTGKKLLKMLHRSQVLRPQNWLFKVLFNF